MREWIIILIGLNGQISQPDNLRMIFPSEEACELYLYQNREKLGELAACTGYDPAKPHW